MLICLIFCIGFVGCQFFDDKKFDSFTEKCSPLTSVKIANIDYKAIDKDKNSLQQICSLRIPTEGIYPYDSDFPIVRPHKFKVVVLRRISPSNKNKKEVNEIEKSIQDVDFIKSFLPFRITDGIIITLQKENQVLIVWNSERTFLILVNPKSVQESYNITLGRDLMYYDSFMKLPLDFVKNGRLIFEISTSIIVKFGCQIINNRNETTELPLSLSKYRLKNLGGERIFIQGPCLINSVKIPKLEIQNKNNPNLIIANVSLTFENNSFILLTPCLWYTGLYQFKISYQNYDFISDVEIYSIDGYSENIQIKQIDQMNNPNYNKKYIALKIPNYTGSMIFLFYTFDLFSNDQNEIPLKVIKTLGPLHSFGKEVQIYFEDINDEKINIYQQIGFIGYVDESKETKWTNSFSLIWMKNSDTNDYESRCKENLSKINVEKRHFCPYKLIQVAGLLSTFRIISSNLEYPSNYNETYSCFAQVIISDNGVGITCCYNKITNNLVYGQDFYLRNNISIGSYSWTISPFYNLQKHFIHDLIPLHICCSLINNELLCSKFWNKFNPINIKSFEQDLQADVFGDPHVIPYNSSSRYSFLGKGDFQLILTKSSEFNLQGRFYYNSGKMKSLLKAVVFKIPNIHISITTSTNNKTNLNWKIISKSNNQLNFVEVLPFQQENLLIFQSSETTILHIYMRLSNNSRIYIVLERIYYNDGNLEFINMRVHLSNNMKHNIIGGLFGRIDNDPQSTGLYSLNSSDFIQNTKDLENIFTFCNTWYVTNDMNLFFDSNFITSKDPYIEMPDTSYQDCNDLDFCNLDEFSYPNDIVHSKTIIAYEYRVKLDQDWKSLNVETKVCDHPTIKMVKYNSDDFTELSKIYIIGCIDPNETISIKNQSMECRRRSNSFELVWEPNFQNEICQIFKGRDNSESGNEIVYAGIGVSVLILVVLCSIVAFILIKRKNSIKSNTKGDMELSTASNMTLETTYDTVIGLQDEYCTYAEIQKNK